MVAFGNVKKVQLEDEYDLQLLTLKRSYLSTNSKYEDFRVPNRESWHQSL